jgi:hypothetical protein
MMRSPSRFAAELCRTSIEEMIQSGRSFSEVEDRIASSGLPDEERAELWQFGWRAWTARLRALHSASERPRRFTRLAARAAAARQR